MARGMDPTKRRLWSERLRRFDRCDLTVADFCEAEGVSTPSYYEWRRKLSVARGREAAADTRPLRPTFLPVQLRSPVPAAAAVEIHLPNGARVSLTSADVQWLVAAIAAAGQVAGEAHAQEELT